MAFLVTVFLAALRSLESSSHLLYYVAFTLTNVAQNNKNYFARHPRLSMTGSDFCLSSSNHTNTDYFLNIFSPSCLLMFSFQSCAGQLSCPWCPETNIWSFKWWWGWRYRQLRWSGIPFVKVVCLSEACPKKMSLWLLAFLHVNL